MSTLKPLESKWRDIGCILGMLPSTIDSISTDHSQCGPCLSEVIKHWLQLNYDTNKFGQPSWRKLAEAVSGLDKRLFYSLARDHKAGGEESLATKNEQAFHSAGYFRGVSCPFFEHGLCHRPHCHYRHARSSCERLSLSSQPLYGIVALTAATRTVYYTSAYSAYNQRTSLVDENNAGGNSLFLSSQSTGEEAPPAEDEEGRPLPL